MLFTVQDQGRTWLMMAMVEAFLIRFEIEEKVDHPRFHVDIQEVVRETRVGTKSLPSNIGRIEVELV
jgi:hypothetical protein